MVERVGVKTQRIVLCANRGEGSNRESRSVEFTSIKRDLVVAVQKTQT